MIANFPITQVDHIMRRTLYSAFGAIVLGITASLVLGYPLVAPGLVLGLGMAVVNHRVFQGSAKRFITDEGTVARKPFAGTVFMRLGACTVVALLLLVFVQPMGWGVIGALAVFQALLLFNAIVSLIRYQREGLADDA
ncbi:MAG: hypothetical protein M3Y36_05095 [Actinomycetota bacterium]|nr:hypothetical protein [Actinomycetota bacterium]